jgi:hypothetical protein
VRAVVRRSLGGGLLFKISPRNAAFRMASPLPCYLAAQRHDAKQQQPNGERPFSDGSDLKPPSPRSFQVFLCLQV